MLVIWGTPLRHLHNQKKSNDKNVNISSSVENEKAKYESLLTVVKTSKSIESLEKTFPLLKIYRVDPSPLAFFTIVVSALRKMHHYKCKKMCKVFSHSTKQIMI